jgi:hypothetical protein
MHRYTNNPADDVRINLKNMPLNNRLKNNATVLILHHLQVPIKLSNLPRKHYASTVAEIAPMISLENANNNFQRSHHDICTDHIPL